MRAVVIREHGGLDRLELTEVPEPADRSRPIVAVRAVALNHLDLWVRRGIPGVTFPLPIIPGCEVSGVIDFLPEDRRGWSIGDEVVVAPGISCGECPACRGGQENLCRHYGILGETQDGGAAEKISVPAENLLRKPPRLSFAEAAAIPLDFLTSWHMLISRARLREEETVLVHAGASGVGSAAIQIAKLRGARVLTTVGSRQKGEVAKSLGADE